jgi:glucose-6-phosphate dehydrogenase assembly protein OpcA
MIIELTDTNASQIGARILAARSHVGITTGMVFTMIAVVKGCGYDEVLEACVGAGREHPSRILVVADADGGDTRVDATIRLGEDVPGDIVQLWFHGDLTQHRASVLLPLLLPDSPVVVWWPGISPKVPADDPIGRLAGRRITDAMGAPQPLGALSERVLHHSRGDIDLVWTRLTRWRGLLAAALDYYRYPVTSATVHTEPGNAAGVLLTAWLADRLGTETQLEEETGGVGITGVTLKTEAGDIRLSRADGKIATFSAPGLPRRLVALPRRELNGLITEELRRLDEDVAYGATMAALASRWETDATLTKESR